MAQGDTYEGGLSQGKSDAPIGVNDCSVCGRNLSTGWGGGRASGNITGMICEDCFRNLSAQSGMPLEEFLDKLTAPVILMDSNARVIFANKLAMAALGKSDSAQPRGLLGGDVFECEYARLPGGCGQTIHCSGCTIRMAVTGTWMTGIGVKDSPAYLNRKISTRSVCLDLHVTTEKAFGMVLLQVEGLDSGSLHDGKN